MSKFRLSYPYQINGAKLAKEISKNNEVAFNPDVNQIIFHPPQTVEVKGLAEADEGLVQEIVNNHNPYNMVQRAMRWVRERLP